MLDDAALEGSVQDQLAGLIIKFDMMQWPFDVNVATRVLQDVGYVVEPSQETVSATKSDGQFFMDRLDHAIRFDGPSLNALVSAKESFESALERTTGVVLDDIAMYYQSEYILIYLAKTDMHDALSSVYHGSDHMERIRSIVKRDVRPFLIDLSSRGSHNSKTWFRVRIEPKAEGTDRTYYCSAVYRDPSIVKMIGDAEGSEGVVKGVLRMLESGSGRGAAAQA